MMERAGHAVVQAIQARVSVPDKRILVLVGPGNNGSDGWSPHAYCARPAQKWRVTSCVTGPTIRC